MLSKTYSPPILYPNWYLKGVVSSSKSYHPGALSKKTVVSSCPIEGVTEKVPATGM